MEHKCRNLVWWFFWEFQTATPTSQIWTCQLSSAPNEDWIFFRKRKCISHQVPNIINEEEQGYRTSAGGGKKEKDHLGKVRHVNEWPKVSEDQSLSSRIEPQGSGFRPRLTCVSQRSIECEDKHQPVQGEGVDSLSETQAWGHQGRCSQCSQPVCPDWSPASSKRM